MIRAYIAILILLTIYSFSLVDPNITFFQTKWWEVFREKMVYFGYYQRQNSWMVYLILIILLFIFYYFFVKKYKQFNPIKIALYIGLILLISYPLLTHDFFNYMFDARIATFYHQNPYLYKALDFPTDPWLRFMHWTHRTYPYGPTFLLITLIPSFFSFGKFVLSFVFFKGTFFLFYLIAVYYLSKLNRKWALMFATNPLVIVEGLVNSHNDLIGVSFALIGIYYFLKKKKILSRLYLLLSVGIKYITIPVLFLMQPQGRWGKVIFALLIGILTYQSLKSEIQPWYFLNLLIFLPFYDKLISRLNIFFFGLLVSYYPYIRLGGWDSIEKVKIKHWIIAVSVILNLIFLLYAYFFRLKRKNVTSEKRR